MSRAHLLPLLLPGLCEVKNSVLCSSWAIAIGGCLDLSLFVSKSGTSRWIGNWGYWIYSHIPEGEHSFFAGQ